MYIHKNVVERISSIGVPSPLMTYNILLMLLKALICLSSGPTYIYMQTIRYQ